MWKDKYNLNEDDENDPQIPQEQEIEDDPQASPVDWLDDVAIFEVGVYMHASLLEDAKKGDLIPVRLRVRADAYNVGAFTEVLQWNRIPYSVQPAEPEEGDNDE